MVETALHEQKRMQLTKKHAIDDSAARAGLLQCLWCCQYYLSSLALSPLLPRGSRLVRHVIQCTCLLCSGSSTMTASSDGVTPTTTSCL